MCLGVIGTFFFYFIMWVCVWHNGRCCVWCCARCACDVVVVHGVAGDVIYHGFGVICAVIGVVGAVTGVS